MRCKSAEARLETAQAVPVVTLDPEGRVHQSVAQPGHPVRPLESDGPQAAGTVIERPLKVPVSDDGAAGKPYPAHSEHGARIALATGLEVTAQSLEIPGNVAQR